MMDVLELRWLYEHKVYETRHGLYLPDFFLYGVGAYLEVKGPCPNQIEIEKALDVQRLSGCPVVFAWGDMKSDVNGVNGSKLSFLKGKGLVHVDGHEFAPLIEHGLSLKHFYRHLSVGEQQRVSGSKSASDILRNLFFDLIGRDRMECDRAAHHKPLNNHRFVLHAVHSKSELAVSAFLATRLGSDNVGL